jgi:Methyltransferase domain
MHRMIGTVGLTPKWSVLDVGGTLSIWRDASVVPRITFVNLRAPKRRIPDGMHFVLGDGTRLPFVDQSFDLVFCNSVIEHLGTKEAQEALAREIARVGRAYYVQTPYRWFPVEPHYMSLLIHFLPRAWQRRLMRYFSLRGVLNRPSPARCAQWVRTLRLLDRSETTEMFPGSSIEEERFLGLIKSLVVTHLNGGSGFRASVG